jgi:muconolactone D-isomerase
LEVLVRVRVAFPYGMPKSEQQEVIDLERQRGAELRAAGKLLRTWRIVGRKESLNLWRVKDPTELHDILAALPVYPYCELVEVEALAEHPIDPQSHEVPVS